VQWNNCSYTYKIDLAQNATKFIDSSNGSGVLRVMCYVLCVMCYVLCVTCYVPLI
jgi:hypothetical protein